MAFSINALSPAAMALEPDQSIKIEDESCPPKVEDIVIEDHFLPFHLIIKQEAASPSDSDPTSSPRPKTPRFTAEPETIFVGIKEDEDHPLSRSCDSWAEMSGYYYLPPDDQDDDQPPTQQQPQQPCYAYNYQQQPNFSYNTAATVPFPAYAVNTTSPPIVTSQQRYTINPQSLMPQQQQQPQQQFMYQQPMINAPQQQNWAMPGLPPSQFNYQGFLQQPALNYANTYPMMAQPLSTLPGYLSPPQAIAGPSRARSVSLGSDGAAGASGSQIYRPSRTGSNASRASSVSYNTDNSRGESPNAAEMAKWGTRNADGSWSCSYRGCTSRIAFTRGCDLRKHHRRHNKTLFCRYTGCSQSTSGGFSSNKDRMRHEQSHNPNIHCEWPGCEKKFSRVDNMKDHVKRVHKKK